MAPSSIKFKDASEVKGNEEAGLGAMQLYARSKLGDLLLVRAVNDYVLQRSQSGEGEDAGQGKIWIEATHPGGGAYGPTGPVKRSVWTGVRDGD